MNFYKKLLLSIQITSLTILTIGCNGSETSRSADTAGMPPATDTMPVLNPGIFDSSGIIRTPSTGDDNIIVPDSSIDKK